MPKMAMHNDPMQRKQGYEKKESKVLGTRHYEGKEWARQGQGQGRAGQMKAKAMHGGLDNSTSKYEYIQDRGNDLGSGTSIFDPVLCELAYRWFCPKKGNILDPFAGGSVRGIVASKVDRQYVGVDLREEQIQANQEQGILLCSDPMPVWICGDSMNIVDLVKDYQADLIFSCPPYGDLEVYSDNPQDISTLGYEDFLKSYYTIIKNSVSLLQDNRFACFVIGDFRDKKGIYRNFVSHTIDAFIQGGMQLYNEAILVTALGSLPIRAGKAFSSTRKMGKTHQNVLVFIKGDPRKATEACGEVEVTDIAALEEESNDAFIATAE